MCRCRMNNNIDNNLENCNFNNATRNMDMCECGFDDDSPFPDNYMYGQSYVPIQYMSKTFEPEVGLKMGTIFPELVSPYTAGQGLEEINFLKNSNEIKEGCNSGR